jgi:hypothetical protein
MGTRFVAERGNPFGNPFVMPTDSFLDYYYSLSPPKKFIRWWGGFFTGDWGYSNTHFR